MKIFPGLILLLLLCLNASGQDVHFTQFYNSPLTTAPSNTGNFDGDWRIASNYRSQWKQIDRPYLTQSLSYDRQIHIYSENFSAGGLIVNDRSAGTLKVMKFLASLAWHKRISRLTVHSGIQAGFVSKRITPPDESFHEQFNWNTGHFDKSLPNSEASLQDGLGYVDINAGGGISYRINNRSDIRFTGSVYHLNYPNESFTGDFRLQPKKLFMLGYERAINQRLSVIPQVMFAHQAKANETLAGITGAYKLTEASDPNTAYLGFYWRTGPKREADGGQVYTGMKFKSYLVGLSYDVNMSSLHPATSYRGAFEVSFIYTALNTRLKKTEVPCERY